MEGVPAGDYSVVSFANAERSAFTPMSAGVSTLDDLKVVLDNGTSHDTGDPLFHHYGHFHVQRGDPVVIPVLLDKCYYRIDLTVSGAEAAEDFTVTFQGASSGIDYAGETLAESVLYRPPLKKTEEGMHTGTLCLPRFGDDSSVTMILASGARKLAEIPLSEYLRNGDVPIDLTAKDVIIPIEVHVRTAAVTVTVNEWAEGALQIPIVGH